MNVLKRLLLLIIMRDFINSLFILFIMLEINLSRESLTEKIKREYSPECLRHAQEAIKNWDNYGGFEKIRDLLLKNIFNSSRFEWKFSCEAFILDSAVDRCNLIEFLIEKKVLDKKSLKGKVIDIGCHLGATVDALAIYGGEVIGTDNGKFAYESPSGRPIQGIEGRRIVKNYSLERDKLNLVSCFNIGWVEDMSGEGFASELALDSLASLKSNGQLLYTFSDENIERYKKLTAFPNSQLIKLPINLDKREKYAFTLTKFT